MRREVMWAPVRRPGFEHCRVHGNKADGIVIGIDEREPFRVRYALEWDDHWRTRVVRVDVIDRGKSLALVADGDGCWRTADGKAIPPLASADLSVAYVDAPALRVGVAKQRYTCLVRRDDGTMHRYESGTFKADVVLDADGLVVEYPRAFTRVWPRS